MASVSVYMLLYFSVEVFAQKKIFKFECHYLENFYPKHLKLLVTWKLFNHLVLGVH